MNTLWHHTHIGMTSHPVYLWHDIQYIWYHPYCFMKKIKLYLASHPHTIFNITATASVWSLLLYQCLHNNYGSLHTLQMYDIIHSLHHIKFRLYDINRQYLGYHKHYIHDIRSPMYDITSTVYDLSSPIPVTSQPVYRYHNTHYVCEYISSIFDMKHTVLRQYSQCIWHHTLHVCVCVITLTVLMI